MATSASTLGLGCGISCQNGSVSTPRSWQMRRVNLRLARFDSGTRGVPRSHRSATFSRQMRHYILCGAFTAEDRDLTKY
jgi:hypothetical protein